MQNQEPQPPAVTIDDGKPVFNSEVFYMEYSEGATRQQLAEHYKITPSQANLLINAGRQHYLKRVTGKTDLERILGI